MSGAAEAPVVTSQKDKNIQQRGATPPGRTEPVPPTMPIKDERDSVVKFDGRPGATFDVYEETILNVAAGKTDERGWSLADHLLQIDENGPLGPAYPIGAATELRKAQACFRRRQKEAYALLSTTQADANIITVLRGSHFQRGADAWQYLTATYRRPVDRMELRSMDKIWHDFDLLEHVGVDENTIKTVVLRTHRP